MSVDITVTSTTTAQELFEEVYKDYYSSFATVYADLISEYPEYSDVINEAWSLTGLADFTYSEFAAFINGYIANIYENIVYNDFETEFSDPDPFENFYYGLGDKYF